MEQETKKAIAKMEIYRCKLPRKEICQRKRKWIRRCPEFRQQLH